MYRKSQQRGIVYTGYSLELSVENEIDNFKIKDNFLFVNDL